LKVGDVADVVTDAMLLDILALERVAGQLL
jgi:hypothetical protein